jgi:hypothetical protein
LIAGATGSEAEQHQYLLKELMPLIEKELAGGAPKKQITAYLDAPVLVSRSREIRTPNLWQNKTQTAQAKVGVGAQGCRRRRSVYVYSPTKSKVPSSSNELAKLQQELHFEQPEPDVEKEELRAEITDLTQKNNRLQQRLQLKENDLLHTATGRCHYFAVACPPESGRGSGRAASWRSAQRMEWQAEAKQPPPQHKESGRSV